MFDNALNVINATIRELMQPEPPSAVEVAINEATQDQWDRLLKAFRYEIRQSRTPDRHNGWESGNVWTFACYGAEFRERFDSEFEAYGEALQHLQDNVPAADVLAALEAK